LRGERGSESASISTTVFRVPSTSMSSRAQKKCWWTLAATPGAISVAYGPGSPSGTPAVCSTPVSLASNPIVPSWPRYQ
jgi:hypothetical protein